MIDGHGWTEHGHRCCDQATGPRPARVARCGGPRICKECAIDAAHRHTPGPRWEGISAAECNRIWARFEARDYWNHWDANDDPDFILENHVDGHYGAFRIRLRANGQVLSWGQVDYTLEHYERLLNPDARL